MAKKKVAASDSRANAKESGAKRSSKSNSVPQGQQRLLTQDEIGHVAGEVWRLLASENNRSLTSIKKSIDAPDVLVLAAIGWLAREGKLQFDASGRSTSVSLR